MLVMSSTRFGDRMASTPPRPSPAAANTAATAVTFWAKPALSSSWRSSAMQAPPGSRSALWSGIAAAVTMHPFRCAPTLGRGAVSLFVVMLAFFADLEGNHRAAAGHGARRPKAGGFLVRRAPWRAVRPSLTSITPNPEGAPAARIRLAHSARRRAGPRCRGRGGDRRGGECRDGAGRAVGTVSRSLAGRRGRTGRRRGRPRGGAARPGPRRDRRHVHRRLPADLRRDWRRWAPPRRGAGACRRPDPPGGIPLGPKRRGTLRVARADPRPGALRRGRLARSRASRRGSGQTRRPQRTRRPPARPLGAGASSRARSSGTAPIRPRQPTWYSRPSRRTPTPTP